MTLGECKALLAIAARNYDKAIPVGLAEDWAEALGDVPAELGLAALRAHIRASEFFPTIAAIRAGAELTKPRAMYLPPHVPNPVPREEIREVVAQVTAKLKGGKS